LAFWQLADSALAHAGATIPESLSTRLSALERPADALERIAASHVPRFAAWADSTGTARPLAWYQSRARDVIRHPSRMAFLQTARGTISLRLFAWDAPLTVYSFTSLAQRHYFDGQRFHRVVPNFVVQAGDPRGDGNGGPGYAIRDEINRHRYGRGMLGMALSGPNTGGSQWFVTHSPQPHLDDGYTIFGELHSGASVLDQIVQGDRIVRITIR
jgi:cyclophilin family peptidyl-prolyl cis-trans isomerase